MERARQAVDAAVRRDANLISVLFGGVGVGVGVGLDLARILSRFRISGGLGCGVSLV